ncbi:MAG TPA: DUF4382 domain-containing protein [Puia sp.]|nr:DUF4382 domain-containing protein [Puia sp.]
MKTKTSRLLAITGVGILLFFVACNKNGSVNSNANIPPGQSKMSIYLNDGPIDFYKVLVDIRQVAVLIDTSVLQIDSDDVHQWDEGYCGHDRGPRDKSVFWDTLKITPGTYDLLQLRNGADTLLGSGTYPTGKVLKVRITLGSDNSVYTDSLTSYPLVIFGPEPYFDINVRRDNVFSITNNDFELWLDFNLERSIFFWSGTFYLKPYIVAYNDKHLSKIEGQVLPSGASALVEAIDGSDTLYAIPNWGGGFQFRGVSAGTYSLEFKGNNGYMDTTINNIVVDSSSVVHVPTVTLHQ